MCHRSGSYIAEDKGLRHLKIQGSKKIDGYCPSEIKVEININGDCSIINCKTHVGHKNEFEHLTLTDAERHSLAKKISLKILFENILNAIRDSIIENKLERIHLLAKKTCIILKVTSTWDQVLQGIKMTVQVSMLG